MLIILQAYMHTHSDDLTLRSPENRQIDITYLDTQTLAGGVGLVGEAGRLIM